MSGEKEGSGSREGHRGSNWWRQGQSCAGGRMWVCCTLHQTGKTIQLSSHSAFGFSFFLNFVQGNLWQRVSEGHAYNRSSFLFEFQRKINVLSKQQLAQTDLSNDIFLRAWCVSVDIVHEYTHRHQKVWQPQKDIDSRRGARQSSKQLQFPASVMRPFRFAWAKNKTRKLQTFGKAWRNAQRTWVLNPVKKAAGLSCLIRTSASFSSEVGDHRKIEARGANVWLSTKKCFDFLLKLSGKQEQSLPVEMMNSADLNLHLKKSLESVFKPRAKEKDWFYLSSVPDSSFGSGAAVCRRRRRITVISEQ